MDLGSMESVDRYKAHFIELVVDKLKPSDADEMRIRKSVASTLALGKGSLIVYDAENKSVRYFSKHFMDEESGISLKEPAPHSFSFNSRKATVLIARGLAPCRTSIWTALFRTGAYPWLTEDCRLWEESGTTANSIFFPQCPANWDFHYMIR